MFDAEPFPLVASADAAAVAASGLFHADVKTDSPCLRAIRMANWNHPLMPSHAGSLFPVL